MKWSEARTRNYFNAADIPPNGLHATIAGIDIEDVQGDGNPKDAKPVLRLYGADKSVIVNVTNQDILERAYGENCEACIGKEIKLTVARVLFKGKMVPGIVIVPITPAAVPQPQPQPQPQQLPPVADRGPFTYDSGM